MTTEDFIAIIREDALAAGRTDIEPRIQHGQLRDLVMVGSDRRLAATTVLDVVDWHRMLRSGDI
jgi:uncharacterized hydantoinase/oxoprolinase family protein